MNSDNNIIPNNLNNEKKIIALAFQGEYFSSKFLLCWTNTLSVLWQSGNYEFLIASGDNYSIFHSRLRSLGLNNEIQVPFNNNKYDYWITIDKNILFTPQQLIELISSLEEHPVVSGLYKTEDAVNYFAVEKIDLDYFANNGSFKFISQDDIDKWRTEQNTKYIPVEFTGLSFIGLRSEVLKNMDYPYFNGDNIIINNDTKNLNIVPTEDYNFCKNIINKNYKIMLNIDLRVGNAVNLII